MPFNSPLLINDNNLNVDLSTIINGGGFIDAIITDQPYNISKKNNFKTMGQKGIDFGEWDKNFQQKPWLSKYISYLKPGGNIVVFCGIKQISELVNILEELGCDYKQLIRWEKTNPIPRNIKRLYVHDCEYCVWAVKKGKWTFNTNWQDHSYLRPKLIAPICGGKEKTIHTTQKPLSIMSELVKTMTNEGDVV